MCPCAELHGLPVGVLIARHVAPRAVQLISLRGRQGPRTPRCSAKIGRASLDNLAALLTDCAHPTVLRAPRDGGGGGDHRGIAESLVRAFDSPIDGAPTMNGGQGGPQDDARDALQLGHAAAAGAHTWQGVGYGVYRPSSVVQHAS